MADLQWLPYDIEAWDERTRELSLEEEGALMRLTRHAWEADDPCTIADSEAVFDRLLGSRWKRLLPLLRRHFTPAPERPGRLRCEWLYAIWQRQLAKHQSYQDRGGKGGRPKKLPESSASPPPAENESSANSPAGGSALKKRRKTKAERKAGSRENTTEVKSCGSLQTHTAFNPPADAPALEGARAAGQSSAPLAPAAGELAAAEAYVASHPAIAEQIATQLGEQANDLPFVPGTYHESRLHRASGRLLRIPLVLAAYRARDAATELAEAPA
jgi:uncharacterized protein YdaU (DUF1376 family)